jgi:hypothetical protein
MTNGRLAAARGTAIRRTTVPARRAERGLTSGFLELLSRLGGASAQLQRSKPRRRGY